MTIPIVEARKLFTTLPEQLQSEELHSAIEITRRGKPVMAVLSWEFYESLMETLEILSDLKMVKKLREELKSMKSKEGIPWTKIKQELDL